MSSDKKITFTIRFTISERWYSQFMSMLKTMESLSSIGSSKWVGLYSDGDGDFRFKIDSPGPLLWKKEEPVEDPLRLEDGIYYDAG